jgi:predicted dinucleotide-binding enzyme
MTIGIIGSGAIGTAFARTLARAGIEATISNSRGPDSLTELVRQFGPSIKAGTREEAARADIVFVAVNWTKLPAALAACRSGPAAFSSTPTIRSKRRCSSRSI